MTKFFSKFSKRTRWIVLAIVVLGSAGGYAYYQMEYLSLPGTNG